MTDSTIRRIVTFGVISVCVLGACAWTSRGTIARVLGADPWREANMATPAANTFVVAELFTSEGCSSCPPADDVLSRLVREPVDGAVVLGLGEHVDYWDRLGWKDSFSAPVFSSRQSDYQSRVFRTGSLYTPQIVIDGQREAVGSDVFAIRRAIAEAVKTPKATIDLVAEPVDASHISVHLSAVLPPAVVARERADVLVFVTENGLTSQVLHGENGGRTLSHSSVVRDWSQAGVLDPDTRTLDMIASIKVGAGWNVHALKIVAVLQERQSRRIIGAGTARLGAA
jgi:hypothetical protein